MSEATAWRYVDETIVVLASWAPGLHEQDDDGRWQYVWRGAAARFA